MDKIISENHQAILSYFKRHTINIWDAEELAQEVFCKILHCNVDNHHITNRAYLYCVAKRILIDYFNKNSRQRRHYHSSIEDETEIADDINVAASYEGLVLAEKIQTCLESMPPVRQAVMAEYLFTNHTQKVLGQRFAVTEKAIQKHISLGKRQITEFAIAC